MTAQVFKTVDTTVKNLPNVQKVSSVISGDTLEVGKVEFDASEKTVKIYCIDFNINKVKSILNITRGVFIYAPPMGAGYLGTASGNVITLQYDTTSMDDSDVLEVTYEWENNYHKSHEIDFTSVVSGGVDTGQIDVVQSGTGMTINQSSGNLTIATGTTANAETILRSKIPFTRELLASFFNLRSQAIINNYLSFMLADTIGDGLAINVTSATAASVTIPVTNRYYSIFSSLISSSSIAMNGMKMFIGAVQNVTGAIPLQYAIASTTVNAGVSVVLNFTVSGWTIGSGTCTLFGWNYIHFYHNGATATTAYLDCGRYGWPSNLGDVAVTITASTTGSGYTVWKSADYITFSQVAITSLTVPSIIADRRSSIPPEETRLYCYLIARNGSTAPASTTTWTIGGIRIEESNAAATMITGIRTRDNVISSIPVVFLSTPTVTANGTAAHDAAISGNPLRIAGRALTANYTAVANGDTADIVTTLVGALITKPFALPELDWYFTTTVSAAATQAMKAATASVKNYLTGLQIINTTATASVITITDSTNSVTLWTGYIPATIGAVLEVEFPTPLRTSTVNAALSITFASAPVCYVNAQGYQAP